MLLKEISGTSKLRDATLCFLIKENESGIAKVCLAMKKRGFGQNRWNGVGGKVGDKISETIEEAAMRETREEICVEIRRLDKVAELGFVFPHNHAWNQLVHVFLVRKWKGKPRESDEMRPQWFSVSKIPYDSMWVDDSCWLPRVLAGELVKAMFVFKEGDIIIEQVVKRVDTF